MGIITAVKTKGWQIKYT